MIDAETQQVVAAETASNSVDDAFVVPNLLSHCDGRIKTLRGDGAYDKRKVYKATSELGIQPIIPPRRACDKFSVKTHECFFRVFCDILSR